MTNQISYSIIFKNKPFFIGFFLWVIVVAVLQIAFTQTELIFWVNRHFSDQLDTFFVLATKLGEDGLYVPVLIYLGFKKRHLVMPFIFTWGLKVIISLFLKNLVNAPRPMTVYAGSGLDIHLVEGKVHAWQSFPSGHTMTAFALALFLSILIRNKFWGVLLLLLAILVAYSRVYLFQHFPKDVFAGSIFGVFAVLIAFPIDFLRIKWLTLRTQSKEN